MLKAAIFDMDGLLIDSEPLWQRSEQQVFGGLGLDLTVADCALTTGLRLDEVVRYWFERHPWEGATLDQVAEAILAGVVELVRAEGQAKPGAHSAVQAAREAGLRVALASSSAPKLIEAALERLGLSDAFEVCRSGQAEPWGKPHPAVYLSTAAALGLEPTDCLALEDSLPGVIAAKAARMRCIAVPEVSDAERAPFAVADLILDSLEQVSAATFSSFR
jgi:sugar-phosphatase